MTLAQFAERHDLARLILADAAELGLVPQASGWDVTDPWEPNVCERTVFLPFSADPPSIPLKAIAESFDCLTWLDPEPSLGWLPVWMCASIYACEEGHTQQTNIVGWTEFALDRLPEDRLPVRLETLALFVAEIGKYWCVEELEAFVAKRRASGPNPEI